EAAVALVVGREVGAAAAKGHAEGCARENHGRDHRRDAVAERAPQTGKRHEWLHFAASSKLTESPCERSALRCSPFYLPVRSARRRQRPTSHRQASRRRPWHWATRSHGGPARRPTSRSTTLPIW